MSKVLEAITGMIVAEKLSIVEVMDDGYMVDKLAILVEMDWDSDTIEDINYFSDTWENSKFMVVDEMV